MAIVRRIWVRKNGGIWNADGSADPATGTGGVDFSAVGAGKLFPIGQLGSSAETFNFGASAFAYTVPSGFTAGWPALDGGWTTFDPAKLTLGSLSNGNLTISNGTGDAWCQAADGYVAGRYYFEITVGTQKLAANFTGGGVGLAYPGISPTSWFNGPCGYGDFQSDGGAAMVSGDLGSSFAAGVAANSAYAIAQGSLFTLPTGSVISVAVDLGIAPSGSIGDMWFGPTAQFVDLSVEANRRLFIDGTGATVDLGSDGSIPFGTAPPVFFSRVSGAGADTFAANKGTGGAFALVSSLTATGTQPPCSTTTKVIAGDNIPQGADPQITLSVSDDGGRTWSPLQKPRSMGALGQYLKRLRWLKMGQFRQRIIRLEITDPVRRNLIGFYEDVTEGME